MRLGIFTVVVGLAILAGLVELLRRRRLREKYAALWLGTAALVLVLSVFPSGPDLVAHVLGVKNGISLVLFLSVVFLLALCMHLTWEVSQLDEKTRVLSEEVALLRLGQQKPALLIPAPRSDGGHG